MNNAANLYDSLFNGKTAPLSDKLQAEFGEMTKQAESKVEAMTEDEKIAEFNRIMGRDK